MAHYDAGQPTVYLSGVRRWDGAVCIEVGDSVATKFVAVAAVVDAAFVVEIERGRPLLTGQAASRARGTLKRSGTAQNTDRIITIK